ncbi:MAG: hypothetical protein HC893_17375 [Chloroflexaceae bacterium]|nr:hypothetical protein [Chloroflexaceae bacterium]
MVDEDPDPEDGDTLGINVYVSDAINGLFDWQLVSHNLDSLPPSDVVITEPTGVIAAGIITVRGTALDGSGVPLVTLTVRNLATNATQTIACPDDAPFDGVWSCVVDLSGAQPGDSYALQARAADRVGLTTDSATLVIDVRAFGDRPEVVTPLVAHFIQGARSHPVLTTAKHFPGHGDTATDSHWRCLAARP